MFEDQTFEVILRRLLDRVDPKLDRREGSVIYDALAPAAIELAQAYIELDHVLAETFADSATREYLIRRAAERGMAPADATYAVLEAVGLPVDLEIPAGTRFSYPDADITFIVLERTDPATGTYKVQAEAAGAIGNAYLGQLVPVAYISGLESFTTTSVLIPGEDEEDTEVFRARFLASFDSQAYGGNVADYLEKTNSLSGVGATKVTPVWNGGGTVLLTIVDADDYGPASPTLVTAVQDAIDPTQDATGVGVAPIGHIVTVQSATAVSVDIAADFVFAPGYTFESMKSAIEAAIESYLLTLRRSWADNTSVTVVRTMIIAAVMSLTGLTDVTGLTINGASANLALTTYQIPVLGEVTDNA